MSKNLQNIYLWGYMGSGKSTVGKALAQKLDRDFIDLDDDIESQQGRLIREIFKEKGELFFRKLEKDTLEGWLKEKGKIIATGGGSPIFYENAALMNQHGHTFYLQLSPKILADRLWGEKNHRPIIAHLEKKDQLIEFIAKHLFERNAFYQKAHHTISIQENTSVDEVVEGIIPLIA